MFQYVKSWWSRAPSITHDAVPITKNPYHPTSRDANTHRDEVASLKVLKAWRGEHVGKGTLVISASCGGYTGMECEHYAWYKDSLGTVNIAYPITRQELKEFFSSVNESPQVEWVKGNREEWRGHFGL